MHKVLISMPDQLATRLKATVPARQRSKIITLLIEKEVARRERKLYECALAVEQDTALNRDLKDWDATMGDGLEDESW